VLIEKSSNEKSLKPQAQASVNLNHKPSLLKFWEAMEMFSPQAIPKKNPQDLN
jgi:hypothetical protein